MNELFEIFDELGYEYFRQGSLTDEYYPDSFFTFWNFDTPNLRHRDNESKEYSINVMVYFYTNKANLIYKVLDEDFIKLAKEKDFIVEGKPHDAPTDKDNSSGRLVQIKIIRKED